MLLCPTKLSGQLTRALADTSSLPYVRGVHANALAFRTGAAGNQIKVMYGPRDHVTLTHANAQTYLELLRQGYVGRFQSWLDATDNVLGVFFNAKHVADQRTYQNREEVRSTFAMDEHSVHWTVLLLG